MSLNSGETPFFNSLQVQTINDLINLLRNVFRCYLTLKTFPRGLLGKEAGREKNVVEIYIEGPFSHSQNGAMLKKLPWVSYSVSSHGPTGQGQWDENRTAIEREHRGFEWPWEAAGKDTSWDHIEVVGRHRCWKRNRRIWERQVWIIMNVLPLWSACFPCWQFPPTARSIPTSTVFTLHANITLYICTILWIC